MRFYYDIRQDGAEQKDAEGIELESLERARHEAVRTLGEFAVEALSADLGDRQLAIEVSDEAGQCVLRATMTFRIDQPGCSRQNPDAGADADKRDRTRPPR